MGVDRELRARADEITVLHRRLRSLWQPGWADHSLWSREYDITLEWYKAATGAFLDRVWTIPDRIRAGDRDAIDEALTYLETAPRCFRSGYVAERTMRRLSRAPLTEDQRARGASIVLAETEQRQSRGWRDIGALGGAVWNEDLGSALARIAEQGGMPGYRATRIVSAAAIWRCSATG